MQPPDPGHPYGHRKFEALAAMIISFFIFFTCFNIASEAFQRLFLGTGGTPEIVATNFIIKAFGLCTNLGVTWYEHKKARELKNDLLAADAKHTLSDSLVSVSVIISMAAVAAGWVWLDTVMALVIAVIILRVGFQIISLHLGTLVDEAVLDPADIRHIVMKVPGVMDCHKIRSRGMYDHIFIDLHVQVEPTLTIKQAHEISYRVEDALKAAYEGRVRDVLVHAEEFTGERPPVVTQPE